MARLRQLLHWGSTPHARHVLITIAIIYLARFGITGCSPYPIYTSGDVSYPPRQQPAQVDVKDHEPDSDVTGNHFESSAEGTTPASSVDPVIFSRIVRDYLGTPYKLGGTDEDGIDCSYLVHSLYRDYDGRHLPTLTRDLVRVGHRVSADELAVGDLVFFSFNGNNVSHVGIYLGDNRFVHASESRGVIISSLRESVYRDRYVGARRLR
ncbi:MAG: glycoside hydrolase [candidate division Zixibacteria bacterium]|nr:glycoside hydrolase [candidate division Zixibacteria bacterium]